MQISIHSLYFIARKQRTTQREDFPQFYRLQFQFTEKRITEQHRLKMCMLDPYLGMQILRSGWELVVFLVDGSNKRGFCCSQIVICTMRDCVMFRCLSHLCFQKRRSVRLQNIVTLTHLNWPASLTIHVAERWTGIGGLQHIYTCPRTEHLH